ncbi:3-oxoacyl-ACP synthase [Myxococcus xanthus]|uniref:3-oxoacyl-ACP synthase n=1 Tax=Myxococcus xanthus TaxID=34 RepID=A0A7Y4MWK0_MYXXA|nr:3-oxoacyl-ACP synthase [Myxococcus xanthus]NOJ83863.1 3-oxoacyl-ACP synthase [Myxococcus xanthus]NOJ91191.1 3-oxoacyl-ACP synthase [Myxococcus xanthus]
MRPSDMGSKPLAVMALGLSTPLGLTARTTQAEIAAGTVRIFQTDVADRWGEPVRASMLEPLAAELPRGERMAALAITALEDCMRDAPATGPHPLPLLLALPEPEGGASLDVPELVRAIQQAGSDWNLQLADGGALPLGRAAFFHALCRASALLDERRHPRVLIGAVDSLCDRESLRRLASHGRTLGGPQRDGIIPGEGAGFAWVAHASAPGRHVSEARGQVLACALARDERHFLQTQPPLGHGLTEVFQRLRAHPVAGTRRADFFLSCQSTESFWGREFTQAYLRNASLLPEPLTGEVVAGSLGDPGASAGIIQIGMALHARGSWGEARPGPWRTLVFGSSDGGHVGGCMVEVHA